MVTENFLSLISRVKTNLGNNPLEMSKESPVVLVFLRHFGCTFCRETVAAVENFEEALKQRGIKIVFVHMSDPENANEFFSKFFSTPIHHISDPGKKLYHALEVPSGNFLELYGPSTWIKGLWYGLFKGRGAPYLSDGDIMQLSAYFVLDKGELTQSHYAAKASDVIRLENLLK